MSKKKKQTVRFHHTPLHKKEEVHALTLLSQKYSFWVATLSLLSFVVGNMVGQHGWYVVWKSVFGEDYQQVLVYNGTVSPIEFVPDYVEWARYGGEPHDHTFRQVPTDALVELPAYDASTQYKHMDVSTIGQIYSVGYAGSYATGGEGDGSHPGIDVRVPIGTPVRTIANGVVDFAGTKSGFGKTIVIKHTNVPDPSDPTKTTNLYSAYAHLSELYVAAGDGVHIAQRIALSGESGFASGPHLHFQIDRENAPWHPYWPFTTAEATAKGLNTTSAVNSTAYTSRVYEYTVHPMHYVQANYQPVTLVASADPTAQLERASSSRRSAISTVEPSSIRTVNVARVANVSRSRARREERIRTRLADNRYNRQTTHAAAPIVVQKTEVVDASNTIQYSSNSVASAEITHDGSFKDRNWETIYITLRDSDGNVVQNPKMKNDVYLKTAYGSAEFKPTALKESDFQGGIATVQMLPRGRRTIVIQAMPLGTLSKPVKYD